MLDIQAFDQINPPDRLLMGPGPINADFACHVVATYWSV